MFGGLVQRQLGLHLCWLVQLFQPTYTKVPVLLLFSTFFHNVPYITSLHEYVEYSGSLYNTLQLRGNCSKWSMHLPYRLVMGVARASHWMYSSGRPTSTKALTHLSAVYRLSEVWPIGRFSQQSALNTSADSSFHGRLNPKP